MAFKPGKLRTTLMVTDIKSNYTSPAGKEFTSAAGRFAAIHPASSVLDIGCGYGDGISTIVTEFRCKGTAVDKSRENIEFAKTFAAEKKLSHLIEFMESDICACDFSQKPFDLILAEGGILSELGRSKGLEFIKEWLLPRGWCAFSDLILLCEPEKIPPEILSIFNHEKNSFITEEAYRKLIDDAGYSVQFMCLVPPSGWDNYYAHMARRLEDEKGYFADMKVKYAFHKEIDVFYRLEAYRYVGYIVSFIRKKR